MRFTTVYEVGLQDLMAMAKGDMEDTVSDMDFLETLALHRCVIVPPWVLRTSRSGRLSRACGLIFDVDGELDKASILVSLFDYLNRSGQLGVGGRFADD